MELVCKICGYKGTSRQGFNSHLHSHKIKSKDYFDTYLKKPGDDICPTCGKPTKFRNMWYGYNKHCSTRCIPLDPAIQDKMKNTCLDKYGTEFAFQADTVKNEIQKTMIKNHGVKSYLQTDACREKTYESMRSEETKNKIKQTNLNRRGVTCSLADPRVMEKSKNTLLEHFGVDNAAKIEGSAKQRAKSMRKNGNASSLEDYLKEAFIEHNIVFEQNYNKDSRYPFKCDFYIPKFDMFIEINNFWMHGPHFYNKNNLNDIALLESWKEKAKCNDIYNHAINSWTTRDIKKRNTAKTNNLNYVVLWNKQDIINWVNSGFIIRTDY